MSVIPIDRAPRSKRGGTGASPPRPPRDDEEDKRPSILEAIVRDLKFVRDPSGRLFAVVGKDILPTDMRRFTSRLAQLYYERTGKDCGELPIKKAMLRIEGADATPGIIPLRYATTGDDIWVDLHPGAVRITANGCTYQKEGPFAFYRPDGMAPLPVPTFPKDDTTARSVLDAMWKHLQFSRAQACVAFAWLIAAMQPERDLSGRLRRYPVLAVVGSHGSGKTSKVDMLRQLVDPRWPLHTDFPNTLRDFAITAENQRVLAYDNISTITPLVSDGLCRRSTGDGIEVRALYSNRDVTTLTGTNPAMINTISDVILAAPDLQSRSLVLDLGSGSGKRMPDEEVAKRFDGLWAKAVGALQYACARALREIAGTRKAPSDIRMGASATWAIAASSAVGFTRSDIIRAYRRTQEATDAIALDRPLPMALQAWARGRKGKGWRGGAMQLLTALRQERDLLSDDYEKSSANDFPRNPNGLRSALKRLEPVLIRLGMTFNWQAEGSRRFGRNFAISFENFDWRV